jgi:hypothetical protein
MNCNDMCSSFQSRSQNVALQFTVTTSLNISASSTPEDIQNAAKEAITRNIASYLWYVCYTSFVSKCSFYKRSGLSQSRLVVDSGGQWLTVADSGGGRGQIMLPTYDYLLYLDILGPFYTSNFRRVECNSINNYSPKAK